MFFTHYPHIWYTFIEEKAVNGPTSLENTIPSLEISRDASPVNKELLEKLKAGIARSPELYATIFDINIEFANDGVEKFKAVNDYLHQKPSDTDQEPNANDQWILFLSKLPGEFTIASDYGFDPATNEAIRNYGPINNLVTELENDHTYRERKEIKEKIKIEQLGFFLHRVVTYHAASKESSEEEVDEANGSAA